MQALAAWLGVLIGSAIREALPALIAAYREFRRATVEDSLADPDLTARLRERVHRGGSDDNRPTGAAGPAPGNDPSSPGVGPGEGRRPGRG